MTLQDVELLCSEEVRRAIDENIERDPNAVALDRRVPYAQLVATQVKYLQRARRKLPHLYEARCIIPPRAFEQSSSKESAERKAINGDSLLDLSCGLGIDVIAASRNFMRVVTVERDEVLGAVVRHNLRLLNIDNVEVITADSETYVAECSEHFDWVFIDPDRRSLEGKKMVRMEDCSPNVIELMPRLREVATRVAMKLSPLFDVEEAFRLFPSSEVEVVSIGGECKELNIYTDAQQDNLRIAVVGLGEWLFRREDMQSPCATEPFEETEWNYLLIPDVAAQKARVAVRALQGVATLWSNNGYGFAKETPKEVVPAKVYAIERIERYRPKELKREFKGRGVEILKRDTTLAVETLRKSIGARSGAEAMIAVTTIQAENWVIHIKPVS